MLREFFLSPQPKIAVVAWAGFVLFTCHSIFRAWISWRLSQWYKRFYDHIQSSVELMGDAEFDSMGAKRQITWLLVEFGWIVLPGLVVHPALKFVRSRWVFEWRMQLSKAYVRRWKVDLPSIEGASQRVQEDTSRFARGVETTVSVILDSLCTLVAFSPILVEIGGQVAPPWIEDANATEWNVGSGSEPWGVDDRWPAAWLWFMASWSALGGIGISACVGRRLVRLEVNNQCVEAHFRKQLIALEDSPSAPYTELVESVKDDSGSSRKADIDPTWTELRNNYYALFRNFLYMNVWLGLFDQVNVIVPYLLAANRLFDGDPRRRISLGLLVQLSSCYGRIFDSLAIVTENWAAVNDWRSVLRRLSEFEKTLYDPLYTTELNVAISSTTQEPTGGGEWGASACAKAGSRPPSV